MSDIKTAKSILTNAGIDPTISRKEKITVKWIFIKLIEPTSILY